MQLGVRIFPLYCSLLELVNLHIFFRCYACRYGILCKSLNIDMIPPFVFYYGSLDNLAISFLFFLMLTLSVWISKTMYSGWAKWHR